VGDALVAFNLPLADKQRQVGKVLVAHHVGESVGLVFQDHNNFGRFGADKSARTLDAGLMETAGIGATGTQIIPATTGFASPGGVAFSLV